MALFLETGTLDLTIPSGVDETKFLESVNIRIILETEKIVHREDETGASESENKTKHSHPASSSLALPTKSCSTSLAPTTAPNEKLDLPLSTEQLRRLFLPFRPLSLSLGWTDGLRLFTAGSSRHSSSRPTRHHTGDSARSRLCCCTPTHPGGGKRHVAILFYCNFLDFVLLFPYFNLWTLPSHFWLTKHHTHN